MPWAARRRLLILIILGAVVFAFAIILFFTVFYQAPSCSDGVQNQGESGVDCGGACAYLCTAEQLSPTVLFTKPLQQAGRTDVIAEIENKNATAAAKAVPYRLTLYGAGQALIQQTTGTLELPPNTKVPVYIPGIPSGKQRVVTAFLSIDAGAIRWFTLAPDPRIVPSVANVTLAGTVLEPRVQAVLRNPSVTPLANIKVVVVVHAVNSNVLSASQTIVPVIPPQGEATATFTWNEPFDAVPATVKVVPLIPLP